MIKNNLRIKENITLMDQVNAIDLFLNIIFRMVDIHHIMQKRLKLSLLLHISSQGYTLEKMMKMEIPKIF